MNKQNNHKYLLYQKEISTDNGITWIKQDSYKAIDLGYSEDCEEPIIEDTIVYNFDGTSSAYTLTDIPESWKVNHSEIVSVKIGNGVIRIGDLGIARNINISSITIPKTVTSIGIQAFFNDSKLTSIIYNGTIAQWNAITKGELWNHGVASYYVEEVCYVHCTDGDIPISEA